MIERMLAMLNSLYPITERDTGEYAETNLMGMAFTLRAFDAEGLGNVGVMHGEVPGMMAMDTLVVNPFEKDMPLFSYDRIFAGGKDTAFLEMYDTKLSHKPDGLGLTEIKADYADIMDFPPQSAWYDDILYNESVFKAGPADLTPRLDELTGRYFLEYLRLCGDAPVCDRDEKIKAASAYTEGLLANGGASTDNFVKAKGLEYTSGMFRKVLFGTGDPA